MKINIQLQSLSSFSDPFSTRRALMAVCGLLIFRRVNSRLCWSVLQYGRTL